MHSQKMRLLSLNLVLVMLLTMLPVQAADIVIDDDGPMYTVVLNGGEGTYEGDNTLSISYGSSTLYLEDYIFTREDYTLLGWSEKEDASTLDYTRFGELYAKNAGKDSQLYAVWGEGENCALYRNKPVDIESDPVDRYYVADSETLPADNPYKLIGWADHDKGFHEVGEAAAAGEIYEPVYRYNAVLLDGCDGKSNFNAELFYAGSPNDKYLRTTMLVRGKNVPCFSKDGYLLTGWEDSSGNLVAAGDNVVGTYPADEDGVITLYARWSKADQLGNGVRLVIDGDDMTELLDRDDSFYGNGWRFYPKGNELRIYGDSYYGDAIAYDGNLNARCSGEVATGQIEANGRLYVYAGSNDAALHVRTSGVSAIRAEEVQFSDKSGMTACQITAEGEGVIGIDAPIIRINCANVTITGNPAVPTDATIVCGSGIDYKVSEDRRTLTTFAIENKITLDGNGGTFDGQKTVDVDYDVSNKLDLSQYAFTRKGYALIGWATDANGSNFVTEYDGVISSTSYDTLYAVWIKVPESYAIFHTLGYSGRLTETVDRVEARENNIFYSYDLSSGFVMPETTEGAAIWEDINTHNLYYSGEKFTPASGAWFDCNKRVVNSEENMHTILLDGNGGTYAYRTGGVTYEVNRKIADYNAAEGETVNYACRFTRPGYTLASYNSEPDGSGMEYALNKCTVTSDMAPIQILYAQWKKNGESGQYITVDGKRYDAAQDWDGMGWEYRHYGNEYNEIVLNGYHGGSIESDVALRVSCSKGQSSVTGCINAPELNVNLYRYQNNGSVSLTVNAKEGAALISQGDMQINVQNLAELSVVGAEGYPAVSAGGELALNLYDEGRISARGGNTAAISAVSIIMSSRRGYLITAGSDPDNAVEVDSYSGQQYVSYEVRTKTLTLHGNGGTADGQDTYVVQTKDFRLALSDYATVFTNDGKLLLGWSKSADATEIDYAAQSGKNFVFDDDSFAEDLYAVWESDSRKGVVLNDYGQRDDTVSPFDIRSYVYHERFVGAVDAGTQYTLPNSYKAGYRFLGWRSAQDGELYPTGTEITVEQSVTYTAEYEVLSMTINGKTYRMDRAHGSRSLGWEYRPAFEYGRWSEQVRLSIYENYSGGPISIPCNVELMAAGKITGTAGQPAVSVDGNVLIEGYRYREDDLSLTITGGAGAPAVRASGRIYAFPSAVPITFWGGDGQPALVGRSVQTGCVMLAGSSESDAVLTGRYHGESFVRVSDELLTVTVQPGQTVPALPEADGVVFVAWRADGRGSVWYRPGDVIEGEEVTLHANYMWDDSGAVILDGNGGTTSSGSKYYVAQVSGADLRLTESTARNGFTRDGYTLSGYNDRADGSGRNYTFRQLADGSAWDSLVGKVLTFFAQWTRNGDPVTPEKPSKPTTPPQTTTPDGSADITVSGSTVKVENVDVDKLVTDNGDKKTAEIDLSGTKSGITDVTLPTDAVKEVAASEAESLTVKLPDVTVSFDDKALAAVAEQSSGADLSLSVNVGAANNSNLTDAQKNAITGTRELSVIEVSLSSNGEKISNFNGGSVTIDVPFQWSMKGLLRAYYIDENGNKSAIDVTYKNGVATLVLNHFSTYVVEAVDALSFTDVSVKEYYFDAIAWAVKNAITEGVNDTIFAPGASCTRAQMVTFLWRANGSPEPTVTELPFTDVAVDAYYAKAVLWAVENGITTGTSDTTFDPDGVVTRAEAVTFLWRAAGNPAADGKLFADVESTKYYAEAVRWAVANGVTKGVSNTSFAPGSACTRAQIVTFLYRDCMNE